MNGTPPGDPTGLLRALAVAGLLSSLFAFGVGFNWFVAWLHSKRDFPSSVLVVVGVMVTTLGAWGLELVTGWNVLLCNLAAFSASGAAMIAGELWRMTDDRTAGQVLASRIKALAQDAQRKANGDET